MKYYISDLHFGNEKALKIDEQDHIGMRSRAEMIVERWNNTVSEKDEVYIIGDVLWPANAAVGIEFLKKLNGRKHLITGNHEKCDSAQFKACFESEDKFSEIIDEGRKVFLCHYPIMFFPGQHKDGYMLYGHVHTTQDYDLILKWRADMEKEGLNNKIFNVGCMVDYMNFIPRTLDELIAFNECGETRCVKRD